MVALTRDTRDIWGLIMAHGWGSVEEALEQLDVTRGRTDIELEKISYLGWEFIRVIKEYVPVEAPDGNVN